jgi:hypothetical protein
MVRPLILDRPPPEPAARDAAAACIAARLEALGRPADLLTGDAVAALTAYAGGSIPRLRAALASTLFLGATEEAPRIDHTYVARAVEALPPDIEEHPVPRPPGTGRLAALMLAGAMAATAGVALVVSPLRRQPAAEASKVAVDSPAPPRADAAPAVPPPKTTAPPAALPAPPSAQQPAPPPLPAPVVVGNPPLPPSAAPLAVRPQTVLQTPRPKPWPPRAVTIVLRYDATDPYALDKLAAATLCFHRAGYDHVFSYPWTGRLPLVPVYYFSPADRDAARAVAAVLTHAPAFKRARWPGRQPALLRSAREGEHPPGTIDAIIP